MTDILTARSAVGDSMRADNTLPLVEGVLLVIRLAVEFRNDAQTIPKPLRLLEAAGAGGGEYTAYRRRLARRAVAGSARRLTRATRASRARVHAVAVCIEPAAWMRGSYSVPLRISANATRASLRASAVSASVLERRATWRW